MTHSWPWMVLALLGAYHGLNPAMGWLFALGLGLQERCRSAVIGALLPIATGHAGAIAVAILLLRFVQAFLPMSVLKWSVALTLFVFGTYRMFRASHPRGGGMRVGGRDLVVWSFLMASAHGAGVMLMPVLLAPSALGMGHALCGTMLAGAASSGITSLVLAVLVHTTAMLIVAGFLAAAFFEFYEQAGLKLLQHAWLKFDLLWALALLVAGLSILVF